MTETIVVALITAVSGIAGVAVGTLFAFLSAKATRKNECEKLLFEKRLQAYQEFSTACGEYLKATENAELYANLLVSTQKVYLVASEETYDYISIISLLLRGASPKEPVSQEFKDTYHKLMNSFRMDLSSYKGK